MNNALYVILCIVAALAISWVMISDRDRFVRITGEQPTLYDAIAPY